MFRFMCRRWITIGKFTDLEITERAANRLLQLNKNKKEPEALRVQVDAGGCHGFQYNMELTTKIEQEDM